MPCPFYGKAAVPLMRVLIPHQSNQCALMTRSTEPCRMEIFGESPDLANCELHGTGRALDLASYTNAASSYPD
jgi:hypothetical protein